MSRASRTLHIASRGIYDEAMETVHFSFRIPGALKERLAQCADELTATGPGRVTMSDLLIQGAELAIEKYGCAKTKRRK